MDNIYNNYRNIIERAVLAGIITEENKQFYLSAIHEENESEISELETQLNMEEAKSSSSHLPQKNKDVDIQKATCSKKNAFVDKQQSGIETISIDECTSNFSEHTVENYSIFDIKDSKYNDFTGDSYSEISSVSQQNVNSKSIKKKQSSNILSKVTKKPKQNRIIDFNIPIYIDIKKRKSTVKPITSNTVNVQPCESSKVCKSCKPKYSRLEANSHIQNINNVDQCELTKTCACKFECSNHKEHRQVQNINKYPHNKTNVLVTNEKIHSPSTNLKTFNDPSTLANHSNEFGLKVNGSAFQKTDFSVLNRKSVYTIPLGKEISEEHTENSGLFSQYLEGKLDKNARHCINQKHAINASRKLALHKDLASDEHRYKQNIKNYRDSYNYSQTHKNQRKSRNLMHVMNKTSKCKHCKCVQNEQVLNYANNIETGEEDAFSAHDALVEQNSQGKDCDRFLNVNIICQFYQEEDAKKHDDLQESLLKKNDASIEPDEKEKSQDYSLPNETAKKTNKIQRLSKLFTNLKIKRKQNEAEFHP